MEVIFEIIIEVFGELFMEIFFAVIAALCDRFLSEPKERNKVRTIAIIIFFTLVISGLVVSIFYKLNMLVKITIAFLIVSVIFHMLSFLSKNNKWSEKSRRFIKILKAITRYSYAVGVIIYSIIFYKGKFEIAQAIVASIAIIGMIVWDVTYVHYRIRKQERVNKE